MRVATSTSAQVWYIQKRSICATYKSQHFGEQVKWIPHPLKREYVLAFTTATVTEYRWKDLDPRYQWRFQTPAPASPNDESDEDKPGVQRFVTNLVDSFSTSEVIDQIILSQNNTFILLLLCLRARHRRRWTRLLVLEAAGFAMPPSTVDEYLDSMPIPPDIAASIERPLDVIGQDRLVFFWTSPSECVRAASGSPEARVRSSTIFFYPETGSMTKALNCVKFWAMERFCARGGARWA